MFKVFATNVIISKGYDGTAGIRFSENGETARFRIGQKVYDSRVEGNHRWINFSVRAFGSMCERIKKMQLKEGSMVNLVGRLDEDVWEDQTTHEKKSATVIILDEVEYCSSGNKQQKDQNKSTNQPAAAPASQGTPAQTQPAPEASGSFTGFAPFGGPNSFFDE